MAPARAFHATCRPQTAFGGGKLLFSAQLFLLRKHFLCFHQAGQIAALVFVKLHLDGADGFVKLRNHHIFKRVDAAPRLFNLIRKAVAGLFHLCKLDQKRQQLRKRLHGGVKLRAGAHNAVRQFNFAH